MATTLLTMDVVAAMMLAPSVFRRRFILGTITGTALALGADFLGSTSAILSLNPELFRGLRVDVLYPIGGYKRCLETSQGFGKLHFGDSVLHMHRRLKLDL